MMSKKDLAVLRAGLTSDGLATEVGNVIKFERMSR